MSTGAPSPEREWSNGFRVLIATGAPVWEKSTRERGSQCGLAQEALLRSIDSSAGAFNALPCPRDCLETVVGNRHFTGDADSIFVLSDTFQCLLDFGNVTDFAVHRDDCKLAIAVTGRLHGFVIDIIFNDHFLA